jgi:hypothetical protein
MQDNLINSDARLMKKDFITAGLAYGLPAVGTPIFILRHHGCSNPIKQESC